MRSLKDKPVFITGANRGIGKAIALWPRTVIDTAALALLKGRVRAGNRRTAQIAAEQGWQTKWKGSG